MYYRKFKVWYTEVYPEPCKAWGMERILKKLPRGFQLLAIFANRSVLDVWWGSKYTSGSTEFSVEGSWLLFSVAWPSHLHTDGVINFDFPVLFLSHMTSEVQHTEWHY